MRSSFGPSRCALKTGADAYSLQSEINALQDVGAMGAGHVPQLILADDGTARGFEFAFYLMTYVPGPVFSECAVAGDMLLLYGERLLARLARLHQAGWVFGDLKGDNIVLTPDGGVQLIDYGGAVRFGCAVKQFTELYDRGYWKAGGRRAEPSYDLFSLAVVLLEKAYGAHRLRRAASLPQSRNRRFLLDCVDDCAQLGPAEPVIRKMLCGEYTHSENAYHDWSKAVRAMRGRKLSGRTPWIALWFAGALLSFLTAVWTVSR